MTNGVCVYDVVCGSGHFWNRRLATEQMPRSIMIIRAIVAPNILII